jgi:hypothetical protein
MAKVTQIQALKSDIVAVKIAELEGNLRADIAAYEAKVEYHKAKYDKLDREFSRQKIKVAKKIAEEEIRDIHKKIQDLLCCSVKFSEFSNLGDNTYSTHHDKEEDEIRVDVQLYAGTYDDGGESSITITESSVATSSSRIIQHYLTLERDVHEAFTERQEYEVLLANTKKKLEDFDYAERQITAEISREVFKTLGITDLESKLKNFNPFELPTSNLLEVKEA